MLINKKKKNKYIKRGLELTQDPIKKIEQINNEIQKIMSRPKESWLESDPK